MSGQTRSRSRAAVAALLLVTLGLVAGLQMTFLGGTRVAKADDGPPLPAICDELAEPGEDPPVACVFGYVYLDGSPVGGAEVTIHSVSGISSLTTQAGPGSTEPYFAAALSGPPLDVNAGQLVRVAAGDSGEENQITFTAVSGAQQVDVWLASACGPTTVGGLVDSSTTWTPDCGPYIASSNVLVQDGVTLTVEAGTEIRFDADTSLQVDGVLQADGATNAMIVFTSNGAGAPGDWGYVLLRELGDVQPFPRLSHALIEYAGGTAVDNNAALRVDGAWPLLHGLTVRHNDADGVRFWNNAIGDISASNIYDNAGWGIHADSDSLSATNGELWVHHNDGGGISLRGAGPVWIDDCVVEHNGGRGIDARNNGLDVYIATSEIRHNQGGTGAGVYFRNVGTGSLTGSLIANNVSTLHGGGIRCYGGCQLSDNVISGNEANDDGGGLYLNSGIATVTNNVIVDNVSHDKGGGLAIAYINTSTSVTRNAILYNHADQFGGGLSATRDDILISGNTVLHNTADIDTGGVHITNYPLLHGNNWYGNTPYDLSTGNEQGGADLDATRNWWGTTDATAIQDHIWDWFDDGNLGLITYAPIAASEVLTAPISPPTGVSASATEGTIDLAWDPNPEGDLAGYQVYYGRRAGFPYDGTGANEGNSPVDVGDVTSFSLTGLSGATYYVTVTAYDTSAGAGNDQTQGHESWYAPETEIVVPGAPQAAFSGSPTEGPTPLSVSFSDQSSGTVDSWSWQFGDGGSSTLQHPTHIYETAGSFTVTLEVSGPLGSDTLTRPGYVIAYEVVSADFTAVPTGGVAPLTVSFTNHSTGDFTACAWDFGDGGTSSHCGDPQHTYDDSGLYTVSLTVTGNGGSDTLTRSNYIDVSEPGTPPTADFTATPTSGDAPLTVTFTNHSTGDYNTCAWDFGDGGTSSNCSNPQYTYTDSGLYTVSLTVSGDGGSDSQTRTDYIAVDEPTAGPRAEFSADVTSGTVPFAVAFTNQSDGAYERCRWDFGDGTISAECAPPAHTYYTAGTFHVSLIVRGAEGQDSRVRQGYIMANAPDDIWVSNGPDGGSVHDLVMAPSNPDIHYAGTDRGVFKSTNGGDNWSATNHPALTVRALAVAPGNPAVVYSGSDDGVYKSSDGGDIWLHQGLEGARVNDLAIRHDNAAVIFAAVGKPRIGNEAMVGVYRSSNGGASWQQVYDGQDTWSGDDAVMAVLVDSDDGDYVYAGILGDEGLAKSSDGGDSWTKHSLDPYCSSEDVYALAMTPAGAAARSLYAFNNACESDVYRSDDRGASWTPTNTPEWFMADYPAALAVDPVNPQIVYVGVTDYHGQLLRSSNAGASWTALQNGMPEGNPTNIVVDPRNQNVYVAQEEGDIYRSADLGDSWQLSCEGLHNTDVNDLALHPHNADLVLAAIDGRGHAIALTNDGGASWSNLPTPPADVVNADTPAEVGALAYDPQDAGTLYASDAWEHYELFLYESGDGGESWQAHKILEVVGGSWTGMGAAEIWVHPADSSVIVVAVAGWGGIDGGGGVYRSFNGGRDWIRKLDIWTNALTADPDNPSTLYAASERCGYVYRSPDAGQTWNNITPGTPPGECWVWAVNDLVVDDGGSLLAATSSGLQRWDGETWAQVADAPAAEMTAVTLDRAANPETIFVATGESGVFVSHDAGATWAALSAGLGTRDVGELAVTADPNRVLYAGTTNAGIWQWQLAASDAGHRLWLPVIARQ